MEQNVRITTHLVVPASELRFRFSRSGGAGGQHVNKVSTRVELLFDVQNSPSLTDQQKRRILARLGSRVGDDGYLTITSQESRSQWRNRELAIERFVSLIARALRVIPPRIATKVTKASRERRLRKKSLDSRKKKGRGSVEIE
ncbi:MAG TPA: aminoacyl-tRNA hydrolase [Bacteroidetes bacterium]|nr:aminoacyl-tRNA hydrolase [Bacteroidota bacterium]